MAVLYDCNDFGKAAWVAELKRQCPPGLDLRIAPDCEPLEDITYVIVAGLNYGPLDRFPNLKAVLSQWAGVNHILNDPTLPENMPVIRMSDHSLKNGMIEYVTYHVLRHHLNAPAYEAQQKGKIWKELKVPFAPQRQIGILGLGALGGAVAGALVHLGFRVRGWSRSPKTIAGVESFAGPAALEGFLRGSEILVCLLPLTGETRDILNAALFGQLPRGAYLINVGRGGHLVEDDLIPAIESGQLSGASLDVFKTEPLDRDHPFWAHPAINITPHMASWTRPETGVQYLYDVISRLEGGAPPGPLADRKTGY